SFLVGTLVILVVLPIIVIGSAALVAQGNVRMWPWIAIASGLIPLGTGCVCGNLVFAFWLLHLMLRKDIRAALASPEIALESKRTR
ncbi:MAG TPA: hypothetical protein VFV87_02800, partial [Pirellulaceae bacterium]|nr:hypothetical protein [Pirellulaceae bacterium]